MKSFSLKCIVAIAMAASSVSSFAANPPLTFNISGTFDEVVPPCTLTGQSNQTLPFGSISSAMPIGTESLVQVASVNILCESKAKVTLYFKNTSSAVSNDVYATTASHMGVKAKLHDKEIKPGEKIDMEALPGNSVYPFNISLLKLAQVEGSGGSFRFDLIGIIETEYM